MPSCTRTPAQSQIVIIDRERRTEIKLSPAEVQLLVAFRKNQEMAKGQILLFVDAMAKAHPRVPATALRLVAGGGK